MVKTGAASRQDVDKAQADADSYDARIAALLEQIKGHELDLQYSRIAADLAGKIGKANLSAGNLVNAGGTDPVLTTIVSVDPIYIDFNVDERAMQSYQRSGLGRGDKGGQVPLRQREIPFSFRLDTEEGYPHQGHLVFADNKYAAGTGTILVRGIAKNPDGTLIPGSRVRVRIPVSDKYQATLVPDTAVNTDQDQKYLLVVGEGNVVKRQNVRLGRLLDNGLRVVLEPELKRNRLDHRRRNGVSAAELSRRADP